MIRYKMLEVFTPNDQTTSSGLRSISWILRTSLDKTTRLSALKSLISMPELAEFPPTLAVGCFYISIRCLYLQTRESAITRVLEQLATLSVKSLVRTVITGYHLSVADPTSRTWQASANVTSFSYRHGFQVPPIWSHNGYGPCFIQGTFEPFAHRVGQ